MTVGTINLALSAGGNGISSNPVFITNGSYGHGNSLVITSPRMSFGTKSISSPAIWETFQNGTVGQSLQTYDSNWVRYNGPNSLPGGARISNDHARYTGSKSAFNDSANGFSTNYKIIPQTRILYGSHWAYVETRGSDTGTMTSTTVNGFTCNGKSWVTDNWAGYTIVITGGKGLNALQPSVISSNTGNTVTSTLGTTGYNGWWQEATVTGVPANTDVPFTIIAGEVGIDTSGGGDSYGTWTTSNGVVRLGYKIRVRCTSNGVDGVVKVGSDVQNPVLTVTAVQPDSTSVFKIVPQLQLKQHRFTATPASGGSSVTNPYYGGVGTHALSSWAFQSANTSFLEVIDKPQFTALSISTPVDGWYRVETRLYISDAGVSNGLYEITITHPNGTRVTNSFVNIANKANGETYLIDEYLLGLMFANVITTTIKAYSTDIYVDCNGYSRFEVGDAPTYSACVIREPQPYTAWANGSVTITQNHASISGNKYLYFIDNNNTPSVGMLLS